MTSLAYAQSRPADVAHAHGFNLNEDWTALPVPDLLVDAEPGDALELTRIATLRSSQSSDVDFQVLAIDPRGVVRRHLGGATGLSSLAMTKTDSNRSASALVVLQPDDVADGPLRLRLAARARRGAGGAVEVENPALEWWCTNSGPLAAPAPPLAPSATSTHAETRVSATADGADMPVGGESWPRRVRGVESPFDLCVAAEEGATVELTINCSAEALSGYGVGLDVLVVDDRARERRALGGSAGTAQLWFIPARTDEQHTFTHSFVVEPSDLTDGFVHLCLIAGNPIGMRRLHISTAPLSWSARVVHPTN